MGGAAACIRALPAKAAVVLIEAYRSYISPLFPACCRYTPSCSEYGLTAIRRFGLARGGWLAVKRIARCHPFHEGGYDPVPEKL